MLPALLLSATAGARSMTPLAAVSLAAATGRLPKSNGAPKILANPWIAAGTVALAAGELYGDKMKSAPDRIVVAGLAARLTTGAIAAAALSPRRDRALAAIFGAVVAIAASYPTFHARVRAMRRWGQTPSGVVEDALVLGSAAAVMATAAKA